jgi:rod shape-determining protein MreB
MRLAGDHLDNDIVQYVREEFSILIGEQVAENVKIKIGSAAVLKEPIEMEVRGRDLINGLPKAIKINDSQVREAIGKSISQIVENIKITLEKTPPELVADIYEHGIVLSGGGALLRGIDKEIAQATKIPVRIADDPLTCVVRGTGILLSDHELLNKVISPSPSSL